MQSYYPEQFAREMGCTEAEWLRWLTPALGAHPYVFGDGFVLTQFDPGSLRLCWRVEAPLRIALIRMPRLLVRFEFDGLDELRRHQFMRRFDLYLLRGGG
jgi:hypothetical protein